MARRGVAWLHLGLGLALAPACTGTSSVFSAPTPDAPVTYDASLSEMPADLLASESGDAASLVDGTSGIDLAAVDAPVQALETGPLCPGAYAGCDVFVDATAANADRTVHFQSYSYDPKCLMIRSGQTVTFAGDFLVHPLTPSCGPELVLAYRDTGATASFTLTAPGLYGYYCLDHGNPQGDAMSGAIEVLP